MSVGPLRVWHVGNWCIHLGQTYVESPFETERKDVEFLNHAAPFVEAHKAIPGSEVVSQPSWELYRMSPEDFASRLQRATAVTFGDVETKCLNLHPDFFSRGKWKWHPLFSSRSYGKGRVTAWMTGASPHWGINFMKWKEYRRFWKQVFQP